MATTSVPPCFFNAIVQASAIHLHVADGELGCLVFSSLSTPSPLLSENNSLFEGFVHQRSSPIPAMSTQESLPILT